MVFTPEQKKAWSKRPEVRLRQKQHKENHDRLMAAAHGISVRAFNLLRSYGSITQATPSLCEHIRKRQLQLFASGGPGRRRRHDYKYVQQVGYKRLRHPIRKVRCAACSKWIKPRHKDGTASLCSTGRCEQIRSATRTDKSPYDPQENQRYYQTIKDDKIIAVAVRKALKGIAPSRKTFARLGYTLRQLKDHLTLTMPKGYDWNDYGSKLKLHHEHAIGDDRRWQLKTLRLIVKPSIACRQPLD